jgi:hypothetical protein
VSARIARVACRRIAPFVASSRGDVGRVASGGFFHARVFRVEDRFRV